MTWAGVFPATTTKLAADGGVDLDATQAGLDRVITSGVSGVIVLPMLGENAALTQAERDAVVTAAKEVVAGRVPLISGLAELSTDDAAWAARNCQRLGAEGMMVFPSLGPSARRPRGHCHRLKRGDRHGDIGQTGRVR